MTAAITQWHDRTRLALRQRQTTDTAWLTCRDSNQCSSWVGRRGGSQDVNLSAQCGTGATIHEIGHAVGLWHEQSREDRDTFVTIHWQNIQAGQSHNFNQHISDGDDVGAYDFGSIMHYGSTAFGTIDPATGRPRTTISPTQPLPPGTIMGQRAGLSVGDRAAVAQMYWPIYPHSWNTWVGRFEGGSQDQLLYYSPARQVWYLGRTNNSGALVFTQIGDTAGFGDLDDGRPFWVGDFTGGGTTDILFYYPGDDNWWLGTVTNGQLVW
ncbi:M12 family metallopeptidase, partial [Kribbella sp. NPDC049174]|uniref:M12 family metallopeptidase n=1 Tax=Kribbella sp. NPDC049174 TaxID=3364112 RepID=UPI00371A0D06